MLLFNDTKIIKNKRLLRNKFKNNELQCYRYLQIIMGLVNIIKQLDYAFKGKTN